MSWWRAATLCAGKNGVEWNMGSTVEQPAIARAKAFHAGELDGYECVALQNLVTQVPQPLSLLRFQAIDALHEEHVRVFAIRRRRGVDPRCRRSCLGTLFVVLSTVVVLPFAQPNVAFSAAKSHPTSAGAYPQAKPKDQLKLHLWMVSGQPVYILKTVLSQVLARILAGIPCFALHANRFQFLDELTSRLARRVLARFRRAENAKSSRLCGP